MTSSPSDLDARITALTERTLALANAGHVQIVCVPDDGAYTVGLEPQRPELVVVGHLHPTILIGILADAVDHVRESGESLKCGERFGRDEAPLVIVEAPVVPELAYLAITRTGRALRMRQVLWQDPDGRFPLDEGYDVERFPQPLLSVPLDDV